MMGVFTLQLITLGFASEQNERNEVQGGAEVDDQVTAIGSAGIINCGLSLLSLIFMNLCNATFKSAEGNTNCCDNNCCKVSNDCCMTERCCGMEMFCSFGRFVLFALAVSYFAVVLVRAAVAADRINELLEQFEDQKQAEYAENAASLSLNLNMISASGIVCGAAVAFVLHVIWLWNETSQAITLGAGLLAILFELWVFAYSIKHWDLDEDATYVRSAQRAKDSDLDPRLDTIASLTVVALANMGLLWVGAWFFSDNFATYDLDEDNEEEGCCQRCCTAFGMVSAKIIILILLVISFGLYIARGADAGQMKMESYDATFENTRPPIGNTGTMVMMMFIFQNTGMGLGMSLFGLVHLYFWNRVTATVMGAGFLILASYDLILLGYGSKQQDFGDPEGAELEDDYVSIAALSIIQFASSISLAAIALLFSCNFNVADTGVARAGAEASDEETGTYATETSQDATEETGTSGAGSEEGSDE